MTKEFAQEILELHLENEVLKQSNDRLFLWFTSALLANDGSLPKFLFTDDKQKTSVLNLREKGLSIELVFGGNFELTFKNKLISKEQFLNLIQ